MIYFVFSCGVYLAFIGMFVETHGYANNFLFRVVPVIFGIILALSVSPAIFDSLPPVFIK